jgi:hypothetical protein
MKRFEIVIDLSKQLISLTTALIGGSVVASQWLFEFLNETKVYGFFAIALLFWGLSIAAGVFNIGATINLIDNYEKSIEKNSTPFRSFKPSKKAFISVFDSNVGPTFAMLQQILFALGVISFVLAFVFDKIS